MRLGGGQLQQNNGTSEVAKLMPTNAMRLNVRSLLPLEAPAAVQNLYLS